MGPLTLPPPIVERSPDTTLLKLKLLGIFVCIVNTHMEALNPPLHETNEAKKQASFGS